MHNDPRASTTCTLNKKISGGQRRSKRKSSVQYLAGTFSVRCVCGARWFAISTILKFRASTLTGRSYIDIYILTFCNPAKGSDFSGRGDIMLSSLIMSTVISIGMLATGHFFLVLGITHYHYRYLAWVSIPWCAAGVALTSICGYAVTRDIAHIQVSSHTIYVYFVMLCAGTVFLALAAQIIKKKKEVM